jgi:hypothetical protein
MRYAVFIGTRHEAEGGWNDLEGIYDTLDDAKSRAVTVSAKWLDPWWHVVDLHAGTMVVESD